MPSDILTRLRSATEATHQALHSHPMLMPLTQGAVNQLHYIHVLQCFYGFYAPLERTLLHSSLADDYRAYACPSVDWLVEDLQFYNQPLASLPQCDALPRVRDRADLLGLLYVKEGSLLGGRVIQRHLNTNLPTEQNSLRFFAGLGDDTGRHWRELLQALEQYSQVLAPEDITTSASEVFERFAGWVDVCYERFKNQAGPGKG